MGVSFDDVLAGMPGPLRSALMRPALRCVAAWGASQTGEFGAGVPLAREAVRAIVDVLADADDAVQTALVGFGGGVLPDIAQEVRNLARNEASDEARVIARGVATFLVAATLEIGVSLEELRAGVDRVADRA